MLDQILTVQVAYAVWHQLLIEGSQCWTTPTSAADGLAWGSFAVAKMLQRPNPGDYPAMPLHYHSKIPISHALL